MRFGETARALQPSLCLSPSCVSASLRACSQENAPYFCSYVCRSIECLRGSVGVLSFRLDFISSFEFDVPAAGCVVFLIFPCSAVSPPLLMSTAYMAHLRLQATAVLQLGHAAGRVSQQSKTSLIRYVTRRIRLAANPVRDSGRVEPPKCSLEFSPSDNVLLSLPTELVRQLCTCKHKQQARGATS